jgi:hypothetical protein
MLLESIDATIHGLLGDEPIRALFDRLDNDFHLKHEEIPDRLEEFEKALTTLFGSVAPIITRATACHLYAKLQIPYDAKEHGLKNHVTNCRHQIEQRRVNEVF